MSRCQHVWFENWQTWKTLKIFFLGILGEGTERLQKKGDFFISKTIWVIISLPRWTSSRGNKSPWEFHRWLLESKRTNWREVVQKMGSKCWVWICETSKPLAGNDKSYSYHLPHFHSVILLGVALWQTNMIISKSTFSRCTCIVHIFGMYIGPYHLSQYQAINLRAINPS